MQDQGGVIYQSQ